MAKKYTRKQIGSLDQLDLEQERIRSKNRKIENDFVEMLNPQQLLITYLGGFLSRRIAGNKKGKSFTANIKSDGKVAYADSAIGKLDHIRKHPLFKKLLKTVGISFLKWQAFNLALFAGKKIYHTIKDKRKRRSTAA